MARFLGLIVLLLAGMNKSYASPLRSLAQLIVAPTPSQLCTGAVFEVHFSEEDGIIEQPDTFIVELSDPTGEFPTPPRIIGSGTASPITVTIPVVPTGNLYKLQVISPQSGKRGLSPNLMWIVDISNIHLFCEAHPPISQPGPVSLTLNVRGLFILPYELKLYIDPGDGSPIRVDSNLGFPYVYVHTYQTPGIYVVRFALEYPAPGCRKECHTTLYVPRLSFTRSIPPYMCVGDTLTIEYTHTYFPDTVAFYGELYTPTGSHRDTLRGSSPLQWIFPPSLPSGSYFIRMCAQTVPRITSDSVLINVINLLSLTCSAVPSSQLPEETLTIRVEGQVLPSGPFVIDIDFGDGSAPLRIDSVMGLPFGQAYAYSRNGFYIIRVHVRHQPSGCSIACEIPVHIGGERLRAIAITPSKVCGGDSFSVSYTAAGINFAPENEFQVEVQNRGGQTVLECMMSGRGREGEIPCWVPLGFAPDTYIVRVRSTSPRYESDTLFLILEGAPLAAFHAPTKVCEAAPIAFENLSRQADRYRWDFGDGSFDESFAPIHVYTRAGVYPVTLTAYSGEHCMHAFVQTVEIIPQPKAAFDLLPPVLYLPAHDPVKTVNRSEGAAAYVWDLGSGQTRTEFEPLVLYTEPGVYPVQLIAISPEGCQDTALHLLRVVETGIGTIPNFFSPNGDGINDELRIPYAGMRYVTLSVWDRWGNLLYRQTAHTPESFLAWDGMTEKNALPDGTYFGLLEGETLNGESLRQAFSITIFR